MTVFHLQITYKLQAIEIKSSSSVYLYVYVYQSMVMNNRSDQVKVIDFHLRAIKLHDLKVRVLSNIWQGNTASVQGWWAD